MVEKLNLFLDLLQSYKVSSAVLLPMRKLFRAILCFLKGVTPTGWKTVWEASSEANWASGRGRGAAVGLSWSAHLVMRTCQTANPARNLKT